MKKGYKSCPYCSNEIKAKAIKCQFCGEFLNKDSTKECPFCYNEIDASVSTCPICKENLGNGLLNKSNTSKTNQEIPSRGERIGAFILDLLLTYTIIGGIINIFLALSNKRTTLGNMIVGIKAIKNDGNKISKKQSILRFFLFYPMFLFVTFAILIICAFVVGIVLGILSVEDSYSVGYSIGYFYGSMIGYPCIILGIMSLIEIFYSCPTYIDKWIGMNRIKENK